MPAANSPPCSPRYLDQKPVVLALPRGGVPVGYEVSKALEAPLDVLLVRKIGAPAHPELAIGAVVDGANPQVVLNEQIVQKLGIGEEYIKSEERGSSPRSSAGVFFITEDVWLWISAAVPSLSWMTALPQAPR
jgi:Predicted phosphoribosyltransferases